MQNMTLLTPVTNRLHARSSTQSRPSLPIKQNSQHSSKSQVVQSVKSDLETPIKSDKI